MSHFGLDWVTNVQKDTHTQPARRHPSEFNPTRNTVYPDNVSLSGSRIFNYNHPGDYETKPELKSNQQYHQPQISDEESETLRALNMRKLEEHIEGSGFGNYVVNIDDKCAKIQESHNKNSYLFEYSKEVLKQNDAVIIPLHCNRVSQRTIHGGVMLPTNPDLKRTGNSLTYEYRASNPILAFGHRSNYAQGLYVPYSSTPTGNVENVYVGKLSLMNVNSNLPYAIGVVCMERHPDKVSEGTAYPDANCYENTTAASGQQLFHGIIPPFAKDYSVTLYKNSTGITHTWGAKYPDLRATKKSIYKGCSAALNVVYVPITSVIAEYIFANAHLEGWELPVRGTHTHDSQALACSIPQVTKAVKMIRNIIEQNIPVFNMANFYLKFVPITKPEHAKLDVMRHTSEYKAKYENSKLEVTEQARALQAEAERKVNFEALNFNLECLLMFRDEISLNDNSEFPGSSEVDDSVTEASIDKLPW